MKERTLKKANDIKRDISQIKDFDRTVNRIAYDKISNITATDLHCVIVLINGKLINNKFYNKRSQEIFMNFIDNLANLNKKTIRDLETEFKNL